MAAAPVVYLVVGVLGEYYLGTSSLLALLGISSADNRQAILGLVAMASVWDAFPWGFVPRSRMPLRVFGWLSAQLRGTRWGSVRSVPRPRIFGVKSSSNKYLQPQTKIFSKLELHGWNREAAVLKKDMPSGGRNEMKRPPGRSLQGPRRGGLIPRV